MKITKTRRSLLRGAAIISTMALWAACPTIQPAIAADAALVAAAEKEGQVVLYGDPFTVPLLVKAFSAKYPKIKVTSATGDGWQIYNRFVAENTAGRPIMDIMYQAEDTVITAKTSGYLADFTSSEAGNLTKLGQVPGGGYARGNGNLILFAYNHEAMANKPTPKDWTDYVNPPKEWEGLGAMSNPGSSSATFATVAALYQNYGADKGGAILKGFRSAKGELNPSMGVMATKLQTGERPLDFFNITNAVSGIINKGAPVTMTVPASGGVAQFNAIGISKNAPHPNAARLLADFALSADMQTIFSEAGVYPVRTGIASPKGLPVLTEVKLMELDLEKALKDRETILNWWSSSTGFNYR
ncbi:ABC transporter substrate-binding protein [Microvirga sp. VF16]|uniref:ABC transporter substrate-binding protein n=1 Tax=Microvirga sp. VF16 TaxID=2807101 RepID=UPI00193E3650|nr:extracellular solute-binding protein [Microvirga sp. VF16]QRM33182.1 extracellular solute-binding protein [Microvirga sp. VF16]